MTGKTHFGIGVMATVILSEYLPVKLSLPVLGVCALASILPDIDHPKSIINKYILPVKNKPVKVTIYITLGVFIFLVNYFYFNLAYLKALGVFLVLIGISSHRNGITHSLSGLLSFLSIFGYAAVIYNFKECVIPFAIGYGLHLFADMFTSRGIPLFYPFKKKKYKMPLTFTVGSGWGNLIEGLIMALGLIYLTFRLPIIITGLK
ncbi:membrane protein [Fervidicella metallireducens AeB]|uniref:Membrane protein n=1 Tax=Fervidicella metallireducens AeB TaxID=1403537 RepID=A0A017RW51_9CLOT|nr:metal-dependent hydrolase [Fervidicella metallireducens]EYE88609.1 membrane protein [Fervidicella metallireducens AeB]